MVAAGDTTPRGPLAASCGSNDGRWYCPVCETVFANNLSHHGHVDDTGHDTVWLCHAHGPEVP